MLKKRQAIVKEDHALIPLGKDAKYGHARIDLVDLWLQGHNWTVALTNGGYAVTVIGGKTILMHRLLLNAPKDKQVDHVNRDRLDNRRVNLRLCSPFQQSTNKPKRGDSAHLYKGVEKLAWNKTKSYRARIRVNNVRLSLGVFSTPEEAARAYDAAARAMFGEFAGVNFGT